MPTANRTREEKIEDIRTLINMLGDAFEDLSHHGTLDYKIVIESYDGNDHYVIGAEESNNWERSWC